VLDLTLFSRWPGKVVDLKEYRRDSTRARVTTATADGLITGTRWEYNALTPPHPLLPYRSMDSVPKIELTGTRWEYNALTAGAGEVKTIALYGTTETVPKVKQGTCTAGEYGGTISGELCDTDVDCAAIPASTFQCAYTTELPSSAFPDGRTLFQVGFTPVFTLLLRLC
jgi:hypothetical protein